MFRGSPQRASGSASDMFLGAHATYILGIRSVFLGTFAVGIRVMIVKALIKAIPNKVPGLVSRDFRAVCHRLQSSSRHEPQGRELDTRWSGRIPQVSAVSLETSEKRGGRRFEGSIENKFLERCLKSVTTGAVWKLESFSKGTESGFRGIAGGNSRKGLRTFFWSTG